MLFLTSSPWDPSLGSAVPLVLIKNTLTNGRQTKGLYVFLKNQLLIAVWVCFRSNWANRILCFSAWFFSSKFYFVSFPPKLHLFISHALSSLCAYYIDNETIRHTRSRHQVLYTLESLQSALQWKPGRKFLSPDLHSPIHHLLVLPALFLNCCEQSI